MDLLAIFTLISLQYGIPEGLLSAMCYTESNHRNVVRHFDGGTGHSRGVCQVKKIVARQVGMDKANLMNPRENIEIAAKYLVYQKNRYGTWHQGIVSYNRGKSSGRTKTNIYFRKVMLNWSEGR